MGEPLDLDLGDFDAVGVATEVVLVVRSVAIERGLDVAATVSAPDGWHRLVLTGRPSGHLVLAIRYSDLTTSRWHNVAEVLRRREWDLDEDREGATRRFPPGTEAGEAAFEVLAVLPAGGAPADTRSVVAVDARGESVDLHASA